MVGGDAHTRRRQRNTGANAGNGGLAPYPISPKKNIFQLDKINFYSIIYIFFTPYKGIAHVAQSVEHIVGNDVVTGSTPVVG